LRPERFLRLRGEGGGALALPPLPPLEPDGSAAGFGFAIRGPPPLPSPPSPSPPPPAAAARAGNGSGGGRKRLMKSCCPLVQVLVATQYTSSPAWKRKTKKTNTNGSASINRRWLGSALIAETIVGMSCG